MTQFICPDCGAIHQPGDTCQSLFDAFLVLEFTDPGYGEVHFYTVACFMIQHGRYSDAGFNWIHDVLRKALDEHLTPEQLRRLAAQDTGNHQRDWKITRQPGARPLPKIAWSMTIADVADSVDDPQHYRETVLRWARVTLNEMRPYLLSA